MWCGLSANLECRSKMCCTQLTENTGRKKSLSPQHRTTLSGWFFRTKACIDLPKNLLNSNICYTCPHNMANFGPLAAEISLPVWGTPPNFNMFRVLAVLLHGSLAVDISQTLRRWTEGATYVREGGHHVGHWTTFLFICNRAGHIYFHAVVSSYFFPHRIISAVGDWMSTILPHMVWP